ncbi:hypothetical protein [Amycolatopsis sp. H20-H5]|uniref:hypothetical protein n=1 Tax=Amycolatopsis sp. H20-H5 TaxID=3046309 RepID=UPI002DBC54EC|nr:hypothetical protein [Amycolatopsis sp. H20-H5]MEC3978440.1 hypothetical protein [Amycolatopsis sp. H20-H5]
MTVMIPCATVSGFAVPTSWAGEVAHHLSMHGLLGPVLVLTRLPGRWLFLTELGDLEPDRVLAPPGVRYLAAQPIPTTPRWIVPPAAGRQGPPSVTSLRWAIRAALP